MAKRLYRSTTDRKIWGVCGGLAEYFNVDPAIVRVIFVVLVFASGLGILLYLLFAIVTPSGPPLASSQPPPPGEGVAQQAEAAQGRAPTSVIIGVILVAAGLIILVGNLDLLWWLRWSIIGPLILIAIGVFLFLGWRRR